MVEIPMGRCPFLLSGIAIIHFDGYAANTSFMYLPNKFANKEEAMKKRKTPDLEKYEKERNADL